MRIVEQRIEWLTPNIPATEEAAEWADEALQITATGARNCYKSEDIGFDRGRNRALVERLIKSGHDSVLEHVQLQFRVITNRGVSHEWVRHRVGWSYSQESTRYCNYSKDKFGDEITVIWPWYLGELKHFWLEAPVPSVEQYRKNQWWLAMKECERVYLALLSDGKCTQDQARGVLPNDLNTEIVCSCNLRSLLHFLKVRSSEKAHPQIRELARSIITDLYRLEPCLVQDIANNASIS